MIKRSPTCSVVNAGPPTMCSYCNRMVHAFERIGCVPRGDKSGGGLLACWKCVETYLDEQAAQARARAGVN